jgi:ribosome-binding protein aMBF1 (putative translation factor)
VGSGSERLGGSDVGKRPCSSYRSVLSFRGPEVEQEKLEFVVLIGDCILVTREAKKMSQGDIEKRTDLNRCYISRVKNGHTVPSLETLEKFATCLGGSPSISLSMPRRAFQYWQAL